MTTKREDRTLIDGLSRPQGCLVLAADKFGGGGQESELQQQAIQYEGGTTPSSMHNHYSRAADALVEKGIFRKIVLGGSTQWWLTTKAWNALGHEGEAPEPAQGGLF